MIYLEELQEDIADIQELARDVANDSCSEDRFEEEKEILSERLGLAYFACIDHNEYEPYPDSRARFGALGTVIGSDHSPTLQFDNPVDPHRPIEVSIKNPTRQDIW